MSIVQDDIDRLIKMVDGDVGYSMFVRLLPIVGTKLPDMDSIQSEAVIVGKTNDIQSVRHFLRDIDPGDLILSNEYERDGYPGSISLREVS